MGVQITHKGKLADQQTEANHSLANDKYLSQKWMTKIIGVEDLGLRNDRVAPNTYLLFKKPAMCWEILSVSGIY